MIFFLYEKFNSELIILKKFRNKMCLFYLDYGKNILKIKIILIKKNS